MSPDTDTATAESKALAEVELWKSRAIAARNEYDVLKAGRLRRTPTRETKSESGIYDAPKRALGTNLARDIERNYGPARGIIQQFRANVVGSLGKLRINVEGAEEAESWFNEVWAKDCDLRDDLHFSTQLQNVVGSALREGDMLSVIDDGLITGGDGTGKIMSWESDQIVPMSEDLLRRKAPGAIQDNGILRDKIGRVIGYCVTGKRGLTMISDEADLTIFPAGVAIMPRSPWRLNQGRSVPPMLTAAASFLDMYEMLERELQTAKRAASQYAFVGRKDAVDDWDAPGTKPEWLPENAGKTDTTVAAEGANETTSTGAGNYERLERAMGGAVDYGDPGDTIQFPPADRPNVHMAEFIESVQHFAGMSFGLARAYSLMRADSSYTSFRGDMILSWQGAFLPMQKWLERSYADRVALRVLTWAQTVGRIRALPAGWERRLAWTWPTMPEVDQLDYENSVAQALKNGTIDYARLLGSDWQRKLEAFAKQIDVIRKLGIPLSIFEMKSGGTANPKKDGAKTTGGTE